MTDQCHWTFEEVMAKLAEQNSLLPSYEDRLATRVGADIINLIKTGGARLDESRSNQIESRNTKCATTQSQKQSLRKSADYLLGCRRAIATEYRKDKATRDAFGLSLEVKVSSVHSVTGAIDLFVKAAEAQPAKAQAAALTQDDVTKLKQLRSELTEVERAQEGLKNASKASTVARNNVQLQIEAAMLKLVNAAVIVFNDQPDVVDLFKRTLPGSRKGSAKTANEAEGDYSTSTTTPTTTTETKTDPK